MSKVGVAFHQWVKMHILDLCSVCRLFEDLKIQHDQEKQRTSNELTALHAHIKEMEVSNQEYIAQIAELKSISRMQKEWNE